MTESPPPAVAACLNCGAAFGVPRPRFCPDCGQETNLKPPTLGEFAKQFGGAYFATEGALWRTLKLLLLRPGELTRQYLAGRRRHYVLPLRLYLSISIVVLLLMRVLATNDLDGSIPVVQFDAGEAQNFQLDLGFGRAGMKDGEFYCEQLPAWTCTRLHRRLEMDPQAMGRDVAERMLGNVGAAMFVLLPSFALWLRLAYWNRRLRYTEHLVFALHLHAFWFIALALMLPSVPWLTAVSAIAVPVYTMLALRRVFGGRWGPCVLRAAFVSMMYGLTLAGVLPALALWGVLG
ncbi:MAG: DUF3667 domain-containing protein [Rubrivivax sp.]|nr:DUF3667 domain-containing protein [Rubrivivax sp.]